MIEISNATLAKLGKDVPVALTVIDKICTTYHCQVENVIKYIPDIQNSKTNIPLEKGMILMGESMSDLEPIYIAEVGRTVYKPKKMPFLILDVFTPNWEYERKKCGNYGESACITVPLSTVNDFSILNVPFNNIILDGELHSGVLRFGKITKLFANSFEYQMGTMPDSAMQQYTKILDELLSAVGYDKFA
jgi:hypothetical protein